MNNTPLFNLNKFRKIKNNSYNHKENCLKNSKKWGQKIFFFGSKKFFFVGHGSLKPWLKSTVLHWLSF